jgi:hypothetical protein
MPFTIEFARGPQYVRYTVSGPASLENYCGLIDGAAQDTRAGGDRRVLVDLRGVSGRLNFTDQYFLGERVVEKLANLERLAAIVPDDPTSYNSEKVATRHGYALRGFRSEREALAWLAET